MIVLNEFVDGLKNEGLIPSHERSRRPGVDLAERAEYMHDGLRSLFFDECVGSELWLLISIEYSEDCNLVTQHHFAIRFDMLEGSWKDLEVEKVSERKVTPYHFGRC